MPADASDNVRDNADPHGSLLSVCGLSVRFPGERTLLARAREWTTVVDDVSFDLERGRTLGLVGESGCGKTTTGRAVLRLIEPSAGEVAFDGVDVRRARGGDLRRLRRRMQIVFQDPGGALNPRLRVWRSVSEPLLVHGLARGRRALRERAAALLERCGMPAGSMDRYPHAFSGGQRQRIVLARALALDPDLLILDEPTSALDVSVQAQILNLLKDLQRDLGLTQLLISHDMAVIDHMCDRVAVMQGGRIVEIGDRDAVVRRPSHPYTKRLLEAVPDVDRALGAA